MLKRVSRTVLALATLFVILFPGSGQAQQTQPTPSQVQIPSARPSGEEGNDTIHFAWYPAQDSLTRRSPAVVVLHALGGGAAVSAGFAHYLARRGVGVAVVDLPYHFHRAVPGASPVTRYISPDADVAARTWLQSYSDVSSVLSWLEKQPDVDAKRLGAVGVSLGAIVTHGAMGQDARLKAAVAFLGSGDFPRIYGESVLGKLLLRRGVPALTPEAVATLRTADPISFADKNRPRRVLMVEAARDLLLPPRASHELWKALGRPPIRWVDTSHFGLGLALPQARRAALRFLNDAWQDADQHGSDASRLRAPNVYAPVLKVGFLSGLDSRITPALTVQLLSIGTRPDHLAWIHADVGMTGRGPYVGVAAPINSFIDIGIGRRLGGDQFRPYVGAQVAF